MEKRTLTATKKEVSTYIPNDIVFSILSKLPVKSLKRFQCVRKSWSLLFENHSFMNMFRNNFLASSHRCSYYDGASLLLKVFEPKETYYVLDERFRNKVKLDWAHLFEKQSILPEILYSFGSINGTLCFHQQGRLIVLWNPATHTFKILPRSPLVESSIRNEYFFNVVVTTDIHGFGYDNLTNDYKIIRYVSIIVEHRYYGRNEYLNLFWEIYSLRSNSWKKLDVHESSIDSTMRTQVYMDGVCHWVCKKDQRSSPVGPCLVSFYLSNEVFLITPIPLDLDDCFDVFNVSGNWVNLVVLNGSIALVSYHVETTTLRLSILGELGIKESWIKLFVVGPLSCITYPIGVGMKGEIFFIRRDNELVWFDLRTQTIVELGYKVEGYFSRITLYKEKIHPIE